MDLYAILGLPRGATIIEIKRAYRRLARKYHPDINPGDRQAEARFRQIADAYETLSDPERRRKYDAAPNAAEPGPSSSFGFEGFDFSVSVHEDRATTFGELFAEVFQREGRRAQEPQRGVDLQVNVALAFEDAMRGGQRQVTLTRREACRECAGTGMLRTAEGRCLRCHGSGMIRSARGHMLFSKTCEQCGGTGRQRHRRCGTCGGEGLEARTEAITVKIPPGVADGSRIRVAGKGNAGAGGAPTGDLYLVAQVAAHPLFRREGDDLHMVVPIAVHEAALGAKIEVPTIDSPARLRIPPGTQTGQRFRLRERGAPSPRDGRRGDLVVEVKLVLPRLLDERSKELLREFGRINGEDVRKEL
jgi:molecular chaperone DnaJ